MFGGEQLVPMLEACKIIYGKSARQSAYQIRNSRPFREKIIALERKAGIDPLFPFMKLVQLMNAKTQKWDKASGKYIEHDDNIAQVNALRMYYELQGAFAKEVTISVEKPNQQVDAGEQVSPEQMNQNLEKAKAVQASFQVIDNDNNQNRAARR